MDINLLDQFVDAIKADNTEKTDTHSAIVSKIDDEGTVWVYVAGSDKETPTASSATEVKKGDTVTVEWRNNKLYIAGNYSSPSVGTQRANAIEETALGALSSANAASAAAASAKESAETASGAAAQAVEDAASASAAASAASTSAAAADAKATAAGNAASAAQQSADNARTSASNASEYAARALGNLSTVQNVAETLNWITSHGTMTLTTDTALDPTHVYFVQDNNGDYTVGGTRYAVVTEPNVADISTYYELSIDESLNNYVATHLAVDSEGLWIIPDAGGNKVLISTGQGSTYTSAGTYIIGKVGNVDTVFAKFSQNGMTAMSENGIQIAHLGYGEGKSATGTATLPFFTLGRRFAGSDVGNYSVAEGVDNEASGASSHAEGYFHTTASGTGSHAEGYNTTASRSGSHAEGSETTASGVSSHAEGGNTIASGADSHAEGYNTTASRSGSHAEGNYTTASGAGSHAEGSDTTASGTTSHAEGHETTASGTSSHAEGHDTIARGEHSHAQNYFTVAGYDNQTAIGKFNDNQSNNAFEIGNGTSDTARSNAFTVDWSGNVNASGNVTDGNGNVLSDKADTTDLDDYVLKATPYYELDTTATSGSDKEIYDALVALGWTDCIV